MIKAIHDCIKVIESAASLFSIMSEIISCKRIISTVSHKSHPKDYLIINDTFTGIIIYNK